MGNTLWIRIRSSEKKIQYGQTAIDKKLYSTVTERKINVDNLYKCMSIR